jgi:hypothetical protein
MSRRKHPSKEMLSSLKKTFDEHNWSGSPVGLRSLSGVKADGLTCPSGQEPHVVRYQLPDGSWVEKTICIDVS